MNQTKKESNIGVTCTENLRHVRLLNKQTHYRNITSIPLRYQNPSRDHSGFQLMEFGKNSALLRGIVSLSTLAQSDKPR